VKGKAKGKKGVSMKTEKGKDAAAGGTKKRMSGEKASFLMAEKLKRKRKFSAHPLKKQTVVANGVGKGKAKKDKEVRGEARDSDGGGTKTSNKRRRVDEEKEEVKEKEEENIGREQEDKEEEEEETATDKK
jgi:hypothetical protein